MAAWGGGRAGRTGGLGVPEGNRVQLADGVGGHGHPKGTPLRGCGLWVACTVTQTPLRDPPQTAEGLQPQVTHAEWKKTSKKQRVAETLTTCSLSPH